MLDAVCGGYAPRREIERETTVELLLASSEPKSVLEDAQKEIGFSTGDFNNESARGGKEGKKQRGGDPGR